MLTRLIHLYRERARFFRIYHRAPFPYSGCGYGTGMGDNLTSVDRY